MELIVILVTTGGRAKTVAPPELAVETKLPSGRKEAWQRAVASKAVQVKTPELTAETPEVVRVIEEILGEHLT